MIFHMFPFHIKDSMLTILGKKCFIKWETVQKTDTVIFQQRTTQNGQGFVDIEQTENYKIKNMSIVYHSEDQLFSSQERILLLVLCLPLEKN